MFCAYGIIRLMEYLRPTEKRLITAEERVLLERQLGSLGLVYADVYDTPQVKEHPNDRVWAVELDSNSNIIKSNN